MRTPQPMKPKNHPEASLVGNQSGYVLHMKETDNFARQTYMLKVPSLQAGDARCSE